jgi:hypothetical protein
MYIVHVLPATGLPALFTTVRVNAVVPPTLTVVLDPLSVADSVADPVGGS